MASVAEYPPMTLGDVFDADIVLRPDFFLDESELSVGEKGGRTQLFGNVIRNIVLQGNPDQDIIRDEEDGICMGITFDALQAVRARVKKTLAIPNTRRTWDSRKAASGFSQGSLDFLDVIIEDHAGSVS